MPKGYWIAQGRSARSRGWCGSCRRASIGVLDHFVDIALYCAGATSPCQGLRDAV